MPTTSLATLTRRGTKGAVPATASFKTPWTGPLARASDGVRNIAPYNLDSDSDEDWEDVPGRPKRRPVIPPRITNESQRSDSDSETNSRSSNHGLRDRPISMEGPYTRPRTPAKPETQAVYPRANNHRTSAAQANTYTHVPRGTPVSPHASPYTYGSPSANHQGLMSPAHMPYSVSSPFGIANTGSSVYTPAYLPLKSPTNSNNDSLPSYAHGYIPSHGVSPVSSMNGSTPLPGIHHALSNTDPISALLQQTHGAGNHSPYLYSTPRASPAMGPGSNLRSPSPYVPAYISPQSTPSGALPLPLINGSVGMMTPASGRGMPLHTLTVTVPSVGAGAGGSGPGAYVHGSRAAAPY